ncbi:hypothetical protein HME9302_02582 [Alteripontixanthobacter maritimus]|uniref:HTH cro/C1-type domain-containing protein n=1 Tax=Alteripontixanthobacter maritimus TaxID=2161824 RepID=A0A369QAJ7_9SPHN|nr:DNA N-6-adenine-methyltransferase [Alteripontixanthobacter maritimus]RDC61360.1 hypothetical protein HME9302_02582 [Alteripontixanthobacter maritimus]
MKATKTSSPANRTARKPDFNPGAQQSQFYTEPGVKKDFFKTIGGRTDFDNLPHVEPSTGSVSANHCHRSSPCAHLEDDNGVAMQNSPPSEAARTDSKLSDTHPLCRSLREAREAAELSEASLGIRVGLTCQTIKRLERGLGSIGNLITVMGELKVQIADIGPGKTLPEKLQKRRIKLFLTPHKLSTEAGISPEAIRNVESGNGTLGSLFTLLSVLAPKAKLTTPKRPAVDPVDKADPDSRFTPPEFMDAIYDAFGQIDLDPCANDLSTVKACRRILLSEGGDGLAACWNGRFVFVNPPFSAIVAWLEYAHAQWRAGHAETIACLVPIRTDHRFFHDTLRHQADIFIVRGRVGFETPSGKKQSNFQPLVLVVFGATERQKARYQKAADGFWIDRVADTSK